VPDASVPCFFPDIEEKVKDYSRLPIIPAQAEA
jgi:hypothetical protein